MKYFILCFFLFVSSLSYATDFTNKYGNIDSLKAKLNATNNDSIKIEILRKLGWSYAFIHQDTAISYSKYGVELSRKRHDASSEFEFQKIICFSYALVGDFTKSIYYGFENINLAQKIPDRNFLAGSYSDLSISYREQEDYAAALKALYTAKNQLDLPEINANTKANILGMISSNFERENQLDSALYSAFVISLPA